MKEILILENDNTILSNLQDFIKHNIDGLTFEEINNLNKLKVDQEIFIGTHCDYIQIIRIK